MLFLIVCCCLSLKDKKHGKGVFIAMSSGLLDDFGSNMNGGLDISEILWFLVRHEVIFAPTIRSL